MMYSDTTYVLQVCAMFARLHCCTQINIKKAVKAMRDISSTTFLFIMRFLVDIGATFFFHYQSTPNVHTI